MKKRVSAVLTISGIIILLGGLFTYGLGIHDILPVPRPDLVVWGTSLIGILMIVSGACDLLAKKTRQELIAVSYTHLDVYKRQRLRKTRRTA